jgi:hypothetical protein
MTPSRTKAVDARTREALNSPADLRPESPMAALLAWPLEEGERVLSCRWADGSWLLTGRDVGRAQDAQQRFWMGQPEVCEIAGTEPAKIILLFGRGVDRFPGPARDEEPVHLEVGSLTVIGMD